ncbi:MAG TPA: hypothetical protein P5136_00220 [Methanofastidiosum sp.]|nr:hypothetical protein [Methanofastidiosum sp.]
MKHLKRADAKISLCGKTGHLSEFTDNFDEVECKLCRKISGRVDPDVIKRIEHLKRKSIKTRIKK